MEWLQSIDWTSLSATIGYYLAYFTFYVLLIQTTVVASVKSVSSIFYQADANIGTEVLSASILWSIFILMNM